MFLLLALQVLNSANLLLKLLFLHEKTECLCISFRPEFPGKLITTATLDRIGRRGSMSSIFFMCCLFLVPLAFTQSEGFVTPLLFGARTCMAAKSRILYIHEPGVSCRTYLFQNLELSKLHEEIPR